MQSTRTAMIDESEDGKDVTFHLLIPAWSPIAILEPLHFPDDLQPFYIEGLKHQGKPYVVFNLPAAPQNLLKGIGNVLDPSGSNSTAAIGAATTWILGGTALNGGFLALGIGLGTLSGLGVLVTIPVWFGGAFGSATTIGLEVTETV